MALAGEAIKPNTFGVSSLAASVCLRCPVGGVVLTRDGVVSNTRCDERIQSPLRDSEVLNQTIMPTKTT